MNYSPKTKMTIKNPPFEDVFPFKHGDIPAIAMLVYQRVAFLGLGGHQGEKTILR